jgi:hypothetical protein
VEKSWLQPKELPLLEAWLADLAALPPHGAPAASSTDWCFTRGRSSAPG